MDLPMASTIPNPPPGFDGLSVEEKIDYVQSLWERIAASTDEVPVPEWHAAIVRERCDAYRRDPTGGESWDQVRDEVERGLQGPTSD